METFVTRVENWECDFNGHWNTRFYGQAFAASAAVVAAAAGASDDDCSPASWHLRFHRELLPGTVVGVRSFAATGGALHVLAAGERLSATALQRPASGADGLASADAALVAQALPRGLAAAEVDWAAVADHPQTATPLGLLGPSDLDPSARLALGDMLRLCARGAQHHRDRLGWDWRLVEEIHVAPMLAELRATLFPDCRAGRPVRMASLLVAVSQRTVVTAHLVTDSDDRPVARVELCLLAVDTRSRKATTPPDLLGLVRGMRP